MRSLRGAANGHARRLHKAYDHGEGTHYFPDNPPRHSLRCVRSSRQNVPVEVAISSGRLISMIPSLPAVMRLRCVSMFDRLRSVRSALWPHLLAVVRLNISRDNAFQGNQFRIDHLFGDFSRTLIIKPEVSRCLVSRSAICIIISSLGSESSNHHRSPLRYQAATSPRICSASRCNASRSIRPTLTGQKRLFPEGSFR